MDRRRGARDITGASGYSETVAVELPLQISQDQDAEGGRLTLSGELDIATVPRFQEAIEEMLAGGVRRLTIDLGPLAFLDSSGLREFIALRNRAELEGWALVLLRPSEPVHSIFQVTRADEHLPFLDESAVEAGPVAGAAPFALELELQREVSAPSRARSAFAERLGELGLDGPVGQLLVLLVSEVVSNAVRHSTGPPEAKIRLLASADERTIRVSVSDGGKGFTPRPRDPERLGDGYGLFLLEKAAASWGVETAGGTTVWFELDRTAAPEG